jgi:hypothetical protein
MCSGGYGAKHRNPVAEGRGLNVAVELRGGGRVTRPVTRYRLPLRCLFSAAFRLHIRYRADTVFRSRGEGTGVPILMSDRIKQDTCCDARVRCRTPLTMPVCAL